MGAKTTEEMTEIMIQRDSARKLYMDLQEANKTLNEVNHHRQNVEDMVMAVAQIDLTGCWNVPELKRVASGMTLAKMAQALVEGLQDDEDDKFLDEFKKDLAELKTWEAQHFGWTVRERHDGSDGPHARDETNDADVSMDKEEVDEVVRNPEKEGPEVRMNPMTAPPRLTLMNSWGE
eukprot:s446_g21.t1